ncbi:hypothetical protein PV416_09750 [Streptomyces ipomoeae]|jgi:hypothetical protein|uniref:Putative lipoprotein n=1 Tax=Streptomyces ipomoeae 91-03 TaxID=698759 RepID=L1KJ59_9ACTN|nr:hypothetical protein [Streptomyces ipomoeae]EKX60423.1 putative lipoprotein [Streptomyces ipomoeae 91-03]MDX2698038.1 hypothetical protein [Streptomyces ipomoeae]MDX2821363.1 hypothetical protein [Streptomyces ipomoeae]MDX2843021.1 hypothetical protein [Streptomyces ipomoeae]MDX2873648.1 hypothetical protein [Streptomyces ipomoeae]
MPARATRAARLLTMAVGLTLTVLTTLTACEDGQGVRDEGPAETTKTAGTLNAPDATGASGAAVLTSHS